MKSFNDEGEEVEEEKEGMEEEEEEEEEQEEEEEEEEEQEQEEEEGEQGETFTVPSSVSTETSCPEMARILPPRYMEASCCLNHTHDPADTSILETSNCEKGRWFFEKKKKKKKSQKENEIKN